MATNRGNSDGGGNLTSYPNVGRNFGVTGNAINRKVGADLQAKAYSTDDSGYLTRTRKELETQLQNYKEIAKYVEQMSKTEQNRFNKTKKELEKQLELIKFEGDTRESDYKDFIELIKKSNDLLVKGAKEYTDYLDEANKLQDKSTKDRENELKLATNYYNGLKKSTADTNKELNQTAKILENTSKKFSESMANSLNGLGDKFANLSNMLSLSSIANNQAEQSLRSHLNMQNSIMKQFGMTSSSQYNAFKSSALNTLNNLNGQMGGLFNVDDMYQYFENLSALGITNQKVAQDQLEASILGSKYLGVSLETQQQIFKFMKTTNNYDELNNHNKNVVALLKAELGISKDQLDALSKIAYTDSSSKLAIGMTSEAVSSQSAAIEQYSAALASVYGEDAAKSFAESVNNLILNPDNEGWHQTLGNNFSYIYGRLFTGKSVEEQLSALQDFWNALSSSQLSRIKSTSDSEKAVGVGLSNKLLQSLIPETISDSLITALNNNKYTEFAEAQNKITNSLLKTTQKDIKEYIEDTSELTLLEKINNRLSFIKDWFDTASPVLNLANLALVAYLAAKPFEIYKFFQDMHLSTLLTKNLGAGGEMAGATISSAAVLAEIAAIIGVFAAANNAGKSGKTEESTINAIKTTAKREEEGWLASLGHDIASGAAVLGGGAAKGLSLITGNKPEAVRNSWKAIMGAINMSEHEENALLGRLAALMLFDAGDTLKYLDVSETHKDLVAKYNSLSDTQKADVLKQAKYIQDSPWYYIINSDGKLVKLDSIDWANYHKAGLAWVPRDNYRALLHKGERVLNEKEAARYNNWEKNVGGDSDGLYANQQKVLYNRIVPSSEDPEYIGAEMGLPGGWVVTSAYGTYTNLRDSSGLIKIHRGIDFAAAEGTPIRASNSGIINYTYDGGGYGNYARIYTDGGLYERYGHMSRFASGVNSGDWVARGQLIGYVGSTGNSSGPHVHFQVDKSADYTDDINPWPYVSLAMFGGEGALNIADALAGSSGNISSGTGIGSMYKTPTPATRRFINGANSIGGGYEKDVGGSEKIVNSVDGGFNRLISYLDSISKRQDEQQILLESFSKAKVSGKDF